MVLFPVCSQFYKAQYYAGPIGAYFGYEERFVGEPSRVFSIEVQDVEIRELVQFASARIDSLEYLGRMSCIPMKIIPLQGHRKSKRYMHR